jgi:mannose-6-phosphate isomerase-like protein (cupin superfamily)
MSKPVSAIVVHESDSPLEGWDDPVRGTVTWRTLLSGDRTPTKGLTVGVAEIAPGQQRPFHAHRHAPEEVCYILSGEGIVEIEGVDHPIRAGTTVFVPGNTLHGARNTGPEVLRVLYVFATDSFSDVVYDFPAA